MEVVFDQGLVAAFEALSHDKNPLHIDAVYSRSTQFGRPVVFGMAAVLRGLALWSAGRPFRLLQLKGRFSHPFFAGARYRLNVRELGTQVKVEYLSGETVQASFSFTWAEFGGEEPLALPAGASRFAPRLEAADGALGELASRWKGIDFPYGVARDGIGSNLGKFGLAPGAMPSAQLNALLGSSYLVGMEIPGCQALYTNFDFSFQDQVPSPAQGFVFSRVNAQEDARFNRVVLSGEGAGIRSFTLSALDRPRPVRYSAGEIKLALAETDTSSFRNKVVFISGASRGFGAVLAKCFGLSGATVFANYLSAGREAENLQAELAQSNAVVLPLQGDVTSPDDCQRLRQKVVDRSGRLDAVVCNAFPVIPSKGFLEQTDAEFLNFLNVGLAGTVSLLKALLPVVAPKGLIVLVSSCYVRDPKANFSHYIACKAALESLVRSLALEFPALRFLVVRPPRMLTDQTNVAFDLSGAASPVAVVRSLFEQVSAGCFAPDSNFATLDLAAS